MRLSSMAVVLIAALAVASPLAGQENELGKQVYEKRCVSCHGADGKGVEKMAKMLKVEMPDLTASSGKSEADLLKLLSEGKKPMPAFGKSLSQEELQAVLDYANSLAE